jgi:hypothetical protein
MIKKPPFFSLSCLIHAILSYAEQRIQVPVLPDCLILQSKMTMVNCQFFHSCFRLTLSPDILYNVFVICITLSPDYLFNFFVICISRGVLCRYLSCCKLSIRRRILSEALTVLALVYI